MKNNAFSTALFPACVFLELLLSACTTNDETPVSDCLEGVILGGNISWSRHQDCYDNSVWVSVLNKEGIGKDAELMTFVNQEPGKPIVLENMVEVLLPAEIPRSNRRDTLDNRRVYFRYRPATEAEVARVRNTRRGCQETYQWYDVPVLVPTAVSLEGCPPSDR